MAEFTLKAEPFLGGYERDFGTIVLKEIHNLAIVSIAFANGNEDQAQTVIETIFDMKVPDVGNSSKSDDAAIRLLRLGIDQVFIVMGEQKDAHAAHKDIASKLNGTAYSTDQSDAWVCLEISGARSEVALERICPIDLHASVFKTGQIARTSMEHLGTIIMRTSEDSFTMMSASSSAHSFVHAIETSVINAV